MAEITVKELASTVGKSVESLLTQIKESGLPHDKPDQPISAEDKAKLLEFLRSQHGAAASPKRLSLKRKQVSELKVSSSLGRRKTVTVEVRKRRGMTSQTVDSKSDAEAKRIADAKKALQEEAKKRQLVMDDSIRAEQEAKLKEATKKKKVVKKKAAKKKVVVKPAVVKASSNKVDVEGATTIKDLVKEHSQQTVVEPTDKVTTADKTPGQATKPGKVAAAKVSSPTAKSSPATGKDAQVKKPAPSPSQPGRGDRRGADKTRTSKKPAGKGALHLADDKRGKRRRRPKHQTSTITPKVPSKHQFEKPNAPVVKDVAIPETITVGELSQRMSVKAVEVIKVMMNLGTMATINQVIDQETAAIVIEEMGHRPKLLKANALEDELMNTSEQQLEVHHRAPVVTIMGHVDHGKTSLLDYIRRSKVATGEAGGITQHIGAYSVSTEKGDVCFLDTPGHAAFTAMRARGAKVTDIVILVVAADDGVMPQTIEAIQHSKAAGVPVIVAVNKIDKPEADVDRIRQELSNHEVIPEDWGGENMFVDVSAKTGTGVDDLLDAILIQAEVLELNAAQSGYGRGVIIESSLDRTRGPIATVLVQSGELNKGDILLAGQAFGRVRSLLDHTGHEINSAGPSTPVQVLGLSEPPPAGDEAIVIPDERKARELALFRQGKYREVRLAQQNATTKDNLFEKISEGEQEIVTLICKADVHGSMEAIKESLTNLSNDEVRVNIVAAATGGINETDVNLAAASNARVIGFNVRADATAKRAADTMGVDIRYFSVIYDVIDTVKQLMSGLLSPDIKEEIIGIAEVRDVFRSKKFGDIAGCLVLEGKIKRSNPIRVLRDNVVVYEGELESLRRFKDDVNEVKSGTECGIGVKKYNDIKPGDNIEVFERVEVARSL